ncbi:MAG: BolA/IbaG family iron-sulfur metabolism protein [Pseudomonadales bacterium]|jgi:acid stress-induced BolA-like protein IbaG/YrbA|nr:BolA/IbaG family iron-sulfur metabolism protein [Pseudomonadales bacterium]MBP9032652.1 BolA/IbaG family iron-sulfur metabolism protein [Pseudomonadales bacterium]
MTEDEIRALVAAGMPGAEVAVGGDGYHIELAVVSDAFEGLSRVRRQQLVYGVLADVIRSGALHAVNIRAQTVAESQAAN